MKFSVVTVFPELIESTLQYGVLSQALATGLISIETCNPRSFSQDKHRTVDDRPFGGGDGMVMLAETLKAAINSVKTEKSYVIYLSPQGPALTQDKVRNLAGLGRSLVLVCGRYGGIDQRVINDCIDEELSIGDYVLSGGELGALVVIDAVSRWVPGVLGHSESAASDSFSNGLLEAPQYSRPREFEGVMTPEVLLSGNHAKIEEWRFKVSLLVTLKKRPDLFWKYVNNWTPESKKQRPILEQLKVFADQLSLEEWRALGLNREELNWKP